MLNRRKNRWNCLAIFIGLIFLYNLNIFLNVNELNPSNILFKKEPLILYKGNYELDIEKLRFLLKPTCTCQQNTKICLTLKKSHDYSVRILKNSTSEKVYTIKRKRFENTQFVCNPFNIIRRGFRQKIISYSIYGATENVIDRLKKLARSAKKYFPEWIIRVYHDGSISKKNICELECLLDGSELLDNVDFCDVRQLTFKALNISSLFPPFWRWLTIGDHSVEAFLSRDIDSCIGKREQLTINEWLSSKYFLHSLRDRPDHIKKIHPGLWGFQKKSNESTSQKIFKLLTEQNQMEWHHDYHDNYKIEQEIFLENVQKMVEKSAMTHASFFCRQSLGHVKPFQKKRDARYCFDESVGYGCCEPLDSNNYYIEGKNSTVCPIECRPAMHKNYKFC